MRVWQCFCGCHEKVSIILGVSSIDRFYCIIIISISSASLGSSTPSGSDLFPSASFRYKRKAKKRPWNNSNTRLKFAQIEGIFLRINQKILGDDTEKINLFTAKGKNWKTEFLQKSRTLGLKQKKISPPAQY